MKTALTVAVILALAIPLSGQDRLPYPRTIPNWQGSPNGRWVASGGYPRICAIFADTGNGRYKHIAGTLLPDFVEPKKGFKIDDIQKMNTGYGVIVKIMPRQYLPSDLDAEKRLCSEENQPRNP